ncbi:MAG: ATPase [Deltaproteobacteria bacterium]|nr:MAG: ATPase [Deltaproteobacteria bacterium]
MSSLFDKRLVLVLGKGGVGRSTVAAALAAATAGRGRTTLLYEALAKDRFAQFFGVPEVRPEPTPLRDNLWALNTDPAHALREYGLMVLRFERVYNMVFENRLTKSFLRAIPGLDHYSVLGKAWYHTTQMRFGKPVWDTVVFDMPASGHAISMLRIPSVILDTVPEGPLTRDARKLHDLLLDRRRTAVVMVTLAEEMPTNEAREVAEVLREDLGLEVTHLVVNQLYPNFFPDGSPAARTLAALRDSGTDDGDLAALTAHGALGHSRRRLNERYLDILRRDIDAPRAELPLLFAPSLTAGHIDELAERLASSFA